MSAQEQIMNLMHWTIEQYTRHQHESGLRYLETFLPSDAWGRGVLESSKYYWRWWIAQWDRRTRILLTDYQSGRIPHTELQDHYLYRHSLETINIVPNRVVMENSFDRMIQQLIQAEHASR